MIYKVSVELDGVRARTVCVMAPATWPVGQQFVSGYHHEVAHPPQGWRFASRTFRLIGDVGGKFAGEEREFYHVGKG